MGIKPIAVAIGVCRRRRSSRPRQARSATAPPMMFDQHAVSAPATLAVSATAVQPLHNFSRSNPHDVGVVTLAEQALALTAIELPPVGLLDRAAANGRLRGPSLVDVGYGHLPNDRGRPDGDGLGLRRVATSPFMAVTQGFLKLQMRTDATGEGGVCYGASGSPEFYEPAPGARSNLAVATTSGGDRWRRAQSHHQLFLDDFGAIP